MTVFAAVLLPTKNPKKMTRRMRFKFFALLCLLACASVRAVAQREELMIITTVEYLDLLDGGSSRMYITTSDGKTEEIQLKGLYAFGGYISEKKVKANDSTILKRLSDLQRAGWSILAVTSSTQPRVDSGSSPPSILTRYILIRRG